MQPPERPFVPRRTPTKAQPAHGSVDFTLSRPFVSAGVTPAPLPPIERFLDLTPANASGANEMADAALSQEYAPEEDELPPVEHFLDPLPSVEEYATNSLGDARERYAAEVEFGADAAARENQSTDWVETDWQQYDWRAAGALGDSGEHAASTAWAETDWDAAMPRAKENKPTAAQAIATALDQIAQQIRDGELALPNPGTVTDPRTIASTLAALLGIRQ